MRRALPFVLLTVLAAAPTATAQETVVTDSTLRELVAELRACEITDERSLLLIQVVLEDPERIEALGPDFHTASGGCPPAPALRVGAADVPRVYAARALRAFEAGDEVLGDSLFAIALTTAVSDRQRADFLSSRVAAGLGDVQELTARALAYDPWHGPSLYRRAGLIADAVGRPTSFRGRFAYWCLADEYRRVAAITNDEHIARLARAAANQYEALAPNLGNALITEGPEAGQIITVPFVDGGSCTTVVR